MSDHSGSSAPVQWRTDEQRQPRLNAATSEALAEAREQLCVISDYLASAQKMAWPEKSLDKALGVVDALRGTLERAMSSASEPLRRVR